LPISSYILTDGAKPTVIGGRGEVAIHDGMLKVKVPKKLDFVWVKISRGRER